MADRMSEGLLHTVVALVEPCGVDLLADAILANSALMPANREFIRIDAWVLAELRDLVPTIWLPDPLSEPSGNGRSGGCTSSATAPVLTLVRRQARSIR